MSEDQESDSGQPPSRLTPTGKHKRPHGRAGKPLPGTSALVTIPTIKAGDDVLGRAR